MSEQQHPEPTVDLSPSANPLDGALAAAFGPDSGPPLPAHGSVLQALAAPPILLRQPLNEPSDPVLDLHSGAVPTDVQTRYRIDGEIARGGMGAVLKGRDPSLGRDVAVKVLLETHQGKTELVQRFVEEAQIAGQLQHPGITPVYELGQFADRRPYFTMKLVKGKTLAALLTTRPDLAADRPQLVGIFAQVCQTLAYAHARGVIHRDLKPANVMVGSFGEVQVMDWGLAKVLREGGLADEQQAQTQQAISVIHTRRSAGTPDADSDTQAGSVLGTPAYMAPEQARGEVELVDARADVFGLGAILCEILTGQPPFTGKKPEAMRKAQTAQLDDALQRLDACGADPELTALARHCLSAEPWQRPRDASAVAAAVSAYQNSVAERLRQAELARAAELARTEEAQATAAQERKAREAAQALALAERRGRRLTLGLAAAVLALVTFGALAGLWVQRQWADEAAEAVRQREAVEAALARAGELRRQARWAEARAILEETRNRLGEEGPADLRPRVAQALADLALVDRLEGIRLKRSNSVDHKFDLRGAEQAYAEALREAGFGAEGDDAEVVAAHIRDSAVSEQAVAALDDWAAHTQSPARQAWLLEVARRADDDPWRVRFRAPQVWRDRAALEDLARELLADDRQLARQKPQLLAGLAAALAATQADPIPLLTAAQARHPDDFWLNYRLGNAFVRAKKWEEAVGFYRAAATLRPLVPVVHLNLGYVLVNRQQLGQAILAYRRAIQLDPTVAAYHCNLGRALQANKQIDEAIEAFRQAIQIDSTFAAAHTNLGVGLAARKEFDEAIKEYRLAIQLDPRDALPHNNLANALVEKKEIDEAIVEYRRAIDLDAKLAPPHRGLGKALLARKELDPGIKALRRATELDPRVAEYHIDLGQSLVAGKQLDEATREFRLAIELDPRSALCHYNLGSVLQARRQMPEAIQEFRLAIQLDANWAPPHNNLALILHLQGELAEAIKAYRRAIELDPKEPLVHTNLGNALADHNELDEAVKELHRAIELDSRLPFPHGALAQTLLKLGRFIEARDAARRCLELLAPADPRRQQASGLLLRSLQLLALDQKLAAILAGKEKAATDAERFALAELCYQPFKKLYATAYRFMDEAFAHDGKLADDVPQQRRYNAACVAILAGTGQGNDAAQLDDRERARLRQQALAWLRADLTYWSKQAESTAPADRALARKTLQHWRDDADLAGLRDDAALKKLPAGERATWQKLWAEVDAELKKANAEK
jgi:serine/threonine-protein kinase